MSFNWNLYILLAGTLIKKHKKKTDEHYFRTAISRAYYGAFGVTVALLESYGYTLPEQDTHKEFINKLKTIGKDRESRKASRKMSLDFQRLWNDRKSADYDSITIFDHDQAERNFILAQRIVKNIDEFEKNLDPNQ